MMIQDNHKRCKSETRGRKRTNVWVRSLCVLCIMIFCMICCIGCISYAPSDEVVALQEDLADAMKEINSLKESNVAADQEIDALQNACDSAQRQINDLQSNSANANRQIAALQAAYNAALQQIDDLQGDSTIADQQIAALQAAYNAALQQINDLQGTCETMQEEIDLLQKQLQDLQDSIEQQGKIRIYIDQGHNPTSYHNTGATGNGLYEQDLTFTIGCLLARLLEADGRFVVCLSRPTEDTVLGTDNTSSLDARVQGAKDFKADYFISLHINSFENDTVNGIEVYAAEQDSPSYDFGNKLLRGLVDSTGLNDRGMKLNPELRVLKNATMPAVLLEMGFISNVGDAALLSQSPTLFAQGIYNGILTYFELS